MTELNLKTSSLGPACARGPWDKKNASLLNFYQVLPALPSPWIGGRGSGARYGGVNLLPSCQRTRWTKPSYLRLETLMGPREGAQKAKSGTLVTFKQTAFPASWQSCQQTAGTGGSPK